MGFDWLANMCDRKLNGILADEVRAVVAEVEIMVVIVGGGGSGGSGGDDGSIAGEEVEVL